MTKVRNIIDYLKGNQGRQIDLKSLVFNHNEFFLMIPLFAFVISPLYYMIFSMPFNNDESYIDLYYYSYTINYVIWLSAVAGPIAIAIYFLKQKKSGIKFSLKDHTPMIFFAILCLLMVISTCINGFTGQALHGDGYRNESLLSFLVYFAVMYFCGTLINNKSNKKIIIGFFMISNLAVNILELVNIYITPLRLFEYGDSELPNAIFYQFNHYGYFLMLGIIVSAGMFAMSKEIKYKILSVLMLILNTFILSINTTFGCFLACFTGMFFLVIVSSVVSRKFNVFSVIAFAIFILVTFIAGLRHHSFLNELGSFFTDIKSVMGNVSDSAAAEEANEVVASAADSAGTGRWGLWRLTIGYIREKPLFGWGIEGIRDMLRTDSNGVNDRPHNEYLQYAAFFGIPAAIAYISGIAAHFIKALKERKSFTAASAICLVAAFTYLVSAVFGNTMFYTAPYLFIFMGLATGDDYENSTENF